MAMKKAPGGRVAEKMLTVMIGVSVTTVAMNVATTAVTTGKSELLLEVRMKVRLLLIRWTALSIDVEASLHGSAAF